MSSANFLLSGCTKSPLAPKKLRQQQLSNIFVIETCCFSQHTLHFVCYYQNLLPNSFYIFTHSVRPGIILCALFFLEVNMTAVHIALHHLVPKWMYLATHKKHHERTDPTITTAFEATVPETALLVVLPVHITCWFYHMNMLEYAIFGAIFSCWFMLIHARVDVLSGIKRYIPVIGTNQEHRRHHRNVKVNYGHFIGFVRKFLLPIFLLGISFFD